METGRKCLTTARSGPQSTRTSRLLECVHLLDVGQIRVFGIRFEGQLKFTKYARHEIDYFFAIVIRCLADNYVRTIHRADYIELSGGCV